MIISSVNWARVYFKNFTKLAPLIPRTTWEEAQGSGSPKEEISKEKEVKVEDPKEQMPIGRRIQSIKHLLGPWP